jgi:hypothetical protein
MFIDRRTTVQYYLDTIEPGWRIVEPQAGADPDLLVIEKPDERKVFSVILPQNWFDSGMDAYIEWEIRRTLRGGKAK